MFQCKKQRRVCELQENSDVLYPNGMKNDDFYFSQYCLYVDKYADDSANGRPT